MEIVVNHLTRMKPGFFCAAGLEIHSRRPIRPVLETPLPVELLERYGGPFSLGAILDLGATRFVGKVPEIEDQFFDRNVVQHKGKLNESEFWKWNADSAYDSLDKVFGAPLQRLGSTCALPERHGIGSLGCYWARRVKLTVTRNYDRDAVRVLMQDAGQLLNVPLTDIRFYEADHITVNRNTVETFAARLQSEPQVLVSIGLSRPFRKSEDQTAMHWLQVNNIHLPDSI